MVSLLHILSDIFKADSFLFALCHTQTAMEAFFRVYHKWRLVLNALRCFCKTDPRTPSATVTLCRIYHNFFYFSVTRCRADCADGTDAFALTAAVTQLFVYCIFAFGTVNRLRYVEKTGKRTCTAADTYFFIYQKRHIVSPFTSQPPEAGERSQISSPFSSFLFFLGQRSPFIYTIAS